MPQRERRSSILIFWMSIVVSSGLLFSCADEDCFSVFNNDLLVNFYSVDTLTDGQVEIEPLDTIFYSVKALGNDSVYYDSTDVTSRFALPVNPALDVTTFEFQVLDSITFVTDSLSNGQITIIDTIYHRNPNPHILTVSYERKQRIISVECGVDMGFVNIRLDETTFPDTNLKVESLSRFNDVNVEVFF